MADFEMVDPDRWRGAVAGALEAGYDVLMQLTAVDEIGRSEHVRVLAWLDDVATGLRIHLATLVPRDAPELDSVADLIPAANWLERQVHDFFGVSFRGGDNRPLLNHQSTPWLLKDVLLEPRLATRWPGALEPGESDASPGRRRIVPPGVPDRKLLESDQASAADIALSAAGVRTRRPR